MSDYPDTFRMAQDVLAAFGHVDILVNNAGITATTVRPRWTTSPGTRSSPSISTACLTARRSSSPHDQAGCGRIVNMTSVIGLTGNFGQANYAASKAAVPR